jgi:Rieske Fe-S protein
LPGSIAFKQEDASMSYAEQGRRWFLGLLANALFAVIGLCHAVLGLAYFGAPLRTKPGAGGSSGAFVDIGTLDDLPLGEWRLLTLDVMRQDGWEKTRARYSVWVCRRSLGDEGITVLSSLCPHLGCPINWRKDRDQFVCPCHNGTFDAQGGRMNGPAPRGMDSLPFEVRSGRLWVQWQEFKTGTAERVAVTV